ncbi:MAG TPA: hypothetical protein VMW21_01995 [Patescibacteria group bacterium]|nr:hypothetical protein [Patescibacteria group bacterium]
MTYLNKKIKRGLTPAEQKTTAAFKLMSEKVKTLEKSLGSTQDELEIYRAKYHEADKNNAVQASRASTLVFHEILKFVVSIVCGGIGINLITNGILGWGLGIVVLGIIFYAVIVISDKLRK